MENNDFYPTLFGIGIALIALVTGVVRAYQSREQTRKADEAIEEAESRIEEEPEKAKPAWDLARVTLESYFNRNLSQVSSIFWLSVFVMIIGFAVIVFGIFEAVKKTPAVGAGAIATGAGIITEFHRSNVSFYLSFNDPASYWLHKNFRANQFGGHGDADSRYHAG
jgi:hypothetical protein